VIVELILLALASTIRPTSLAAVYAILAGDAPRRLLTAYIAAGVAFTIAVGLVVLLAFDGVQAHPGSGDAKGIAELAGGVVALGFGVLVLTGRVLGASPDDAPRPPRRWAALRERRLTLRGAVLAGPATHIPGLFYLIALNLIAAYQAKAPRAVLQVLVYNALWFALPLAALAICIADPGAARRAIGAMEAWTREHTRQILVAASLVAGAALVLRGALAL
jgi:Sap-like sulfolipid-1-addressing protein